MERDRLIPAPPGSSELPGAVQVSVIIPVRNGEAFLADAVDSALAQTEVTVQVIVVDDGSTDGTPDLIAGYGGRVTSHRQEGRGASAARNAGIALARGELLVFLDADDLLPPHHLTRFVEAAAAVPEAGVFHCGWCGIDVEGRILYRVDDPLDYDRDAFHTLVAQGCPPISALALRSVAVAAVGPFDETQIFQETFDYLLRLAAAGATFQSVHTTIAIYRHRHDSKSAVAQTRCGVAGLAVLERHLALHERCPACAEADRSLVRWRRAILRSSARDFAARLHLSGLAGRWIGTVLAVIRRPRLAPAAWQALDERLRGLVDG